jgi:hypothetical protein
MTSLQSLSPATTAATQQRDAGHRRLFGDFPPELQLSPRRFLCFQDLDDLSVLDVSVVEDPWLRSILEYRFNLRISRWLLDKLSSLLHHACIELDFQYERSNNAY